MKENNKTTLTVSLELWTKLNKERLPSQSLEDVIWKLIDKNFHNKRRIQGDKIG